MCVTNHIDDLWHWSNYGQCVDIYALGGNIKATNTGKTAYDWKDGTSIIAPSECFFFLAEKCFRYAIVPLPRSQANAHPPHSIQPPDVTGIAAGILSLNRNLAPYKVLGKMKAKAMKLSPNMLLGSAGEVHYAMTF
jgi:hypothetical protein